MSEEHHTATGQRVDDYDFDLPPELIAQQPPVERGQSRMLVVDRRTGALRDDRFASLPALLQAGDLLVLNDSRVIPARLYAQRTTVRDRQQTTAQIEVLLTEPAGDYAWRALVRPGKKVGIGERLEFRSATGSVELAAHVLERGEFGERLLRFEPAADFFAALDRIGHMPLPPYIRRDDGSTDRERYQTVFSRERGSVAAPTAGLHFTPEVLEALTAKGVEVVRITLHVGLGTFAPLRVDRLDQVHLHRERYTIDASAVNAINSAMRDGRRIVAVGTTVVRTLEHCAQQAGTGELQPHSGATEIFISPGFKFRLVSALITNFHLPKSSLLMLVSAFAGRENVLAAYRHAVEQQYRFFSYGDCMFLSWPPLPYCLLPLPSSLLPGPCSLPHRSADKLASVTDQPKPPVFLLDTMAFIFRAYHAMQRSRPMSTRGGLPTAAIYVFVNMIKKLRQDFAPLYCAAVFDVSGEVFRDGRARTMGPLRKWDAKSQSFQDVSYEGYKANRAAMPEDLGRQIPYIRRALEALRIPILEAVGFEADDVIGTLAREAAERGHEVFIVSGDKDMMQLVTQHVKILNPQKDNLILDPAKVLETLGVPPEKVVDVMALRGDTVDNIPGAPGIGDKGSVDLIVEFGSVEAVLDRAAEVKRKSYRESLEQNRAAVLLSKELVTIDCHVPLELDLHAMETQPPDLEACRELFTELEFTSMLRELAPAEGGATVEIIDDPTPEQAAAFYSAARQHGFAFALDAAAPAAPPEDADEAPRMLSLLDVAEAADKQASFSVGVCAEAGTALRLALTPELRALLEYAAVPKHLHDWKLALHVLASQGVTLRGSVEDTMLLSYALNPTHTTQTLADVAARHGQPAPSSLAAAAAAIHALVPALTAEAAKADVQRVYREIDLPLAPVLYRVEQAGVRIDKGALAALCTRFSAELDRVGERIFELAGQRFNINSPKQLGVVLFTHLGLPAPVVRGKGKAISTAQDVLEGLAAHHEVPRLVLEYRHLSKLKSNYIDALPLLADADSRVHTTFQAAATATGRLSSVNPNLQNIPIRTELGREIRAAFTASPGTRLLSADYSQIELRLLAHFSGDALLRRAYAEDIDIHTLTASEVFGVPIEGMDKETRGRAKAVNFGIVYGISAFGLAAQLGIPQAEAKSHIERYFARYQGVKAFIEATLEQTRRSGAVRTLFGRVRPIPDIESRNPNQRGFAERTAVNTPLQGTAADLIKLAMIVIDRELAERGLRTRMVLQVHDELLFEVPLEESAEIEKLVREAMEGAVSLQVPLVADIAFGPNWRDL